jgi:hypothetical protein
MASARTSMVRNLSMGKDTPSLPMGSCRKNTGPPWSRRIRTETTVNNGDRTISSAAAAIRSMAVLTASCGPANTGASTWSKDRPATGRVRPRGPATSVSLGTTTVHFLAFQCPAEAPQPPGVKPGGRGTGHGVGADPLCDLGSLRLIPQHRDLTDVAALGIAAAGSHHAVAGLGSRVQRPDETRQVLAITND